MQNRILGVTILLSCAVAVVAAQTSTPTDGRTLLAQSVAAMAVTMPSDCNASGMAVIQAGGRTENGTITVLTSGLNQSAESIQTNYRQTQIVYSNGTAQDSTISETLPLEGVLSRQTAIFPLPLLAALANDTDVQVQNLGVETVNGATLIHLQAQKTFANTTPDLSGLAPFSRKDIWISPSTYLPQRISFVRRDGGGATPGIQIDLFFSNYGSVQGVQFPFLVHESFNGTPWGTFTFQSVAFNTGLPSSDFTVQ